MATREEYKDTTIASMDWYSPRGPEPGFPNWYWEFPPPGYETDSVNPNRPENEIPRLINCLSMRQLIFWFSMEDDSGSYKNFVEFTKREMLLILCQQAEQETRDQYKSQLWLELRIGRITASIIHEASMNASIPYEQLPPRELRDKIIGYTSKPFSQRDSQDKDNIHMERGRKLEKLVSAEVAKRLDLQIQDCGIFLIPSHPFLGASPDGVGKDFVLEIKCPSSERNVKYYIENGKITERYKAQMMLQMFAAKRKRGIFCVADPNFENNKNFTHIWIEYDEKFTDELIKKVTKFWEVQMWEDIYGLFST